MADKTDVEAVRSHRELDQLQEVWTSLELSSTSPTQHFIWSRAGAEAFGDDGELHIATVWNNERCTALAPLIKSQGLIRRLEMIGVRQLHEPMDFLYTDDDSLSTLVGSLADEGLPLWLGRIPQDSPVVAAIKDAYRRRGWVHIRSAHPYPYIVLDAGWKEPEKQFNSGRRSDFRRAERHAGQLGELSFEILSPAPQELGPLLEEALQVEIKSWKGTEGTAVAVDPLRGTFYRRYAEAASEKRILRLAFMRIDGKAIGMQMAIECHDGFWLLKIGHDEEYSKCSPGTLLMLQTVKYAATRGLRSYEFLGTAAPWTRTWTELLRPCVAVRAYPLTLRGIGAATRDAPRLALSRLKRKLRGES